ncbi:MAG: energy-coupling factor transporter transmembrane protein EcfT [Firmicutes bacterium]|jgi:energy-coupling factor transport system permease protein|nr:energy-coupling factor transporter transmembrane protein EcfT [Bacillota bacterium]
MLKGVVVGQYYPADSVVHKLDPRVKIGVTTMFIVVLFIAGSLYSYLLLALFTFAVIRASRVPFRMILRGLKPVLFILGFTLALHVFFTKGQPLFVLGPLRASREGAIQGALVGARLIILIATTSLLTLTTSPISLTDGLENILRPFQRVGVPAHELAMMMTIALRFIPTLLEEADKIMKAQMARGADFQTGNMLNRAKSLVPLLVPLFVGAFRRADDLAMAMEARCYRGGRNRTRMVELRAGWRDYVAVGVFALFTAGVVALNRLFPFAVKP